MRHVFQRLQHLPAPIAPGSEHRGPSPPICLRDQQRHLLPGSRHIGQHDGPRLRNARFLKIHQIRQLFPALDVPFGIFFQARNQAVFSRRRQFRRGRISMKSIGPVGQPDRQQIGKRRLGIPAVGERSPSAQEQQPAPAPVHELLDQFLLRRRKVGRFHAAQNDPLKAEELLYFGGEPFLQFVLIRDSLPVQLVLRGSQHRHHLDILVVLHRAPQELVIPARFALHIQDARLGIIDVHHARELVVFLILFVRDGVHRHLYVFHARLARGEQNRFGLLSHIRFGNHVGGSQDLAAFLHRKMQLAPVVAMLTETDLRLQSRFRERLRGNLNVFHFDVARELFASEADRVNRNALTPYFGDGLQIDAARIVRPVAEQHHRADRQRGRIHQHFL